MNIIIATELSLGKGHYIWTRSSDTEIFKQDCQNSSSEYQLLKFWFLAFDIWVAQFLGLAEQLMTCLELACLLMESSQVLQDYQLPARQKQPLQIQGSI